MAPGGPEPQDRSLAWREKGNPLSPVRVGIAKTRLDSMCTIMSVTPGFLRAFREGRLEENINRHIQKMHAGKKGFQEMAPLEEWRQAAHDLEIVSMCWFCAKVNRSVQNRREPASLPQSTVPLTMRDAPRIVLCGRIRGFHGV